MEIIFDIATPSLNKFKGKWATLNWKKRFLSKLHNYEFLALKKKIKKTIIIQRLGSRLLDEDNYHGGCKPMVDAIKEKGLIVDDCPKWCEIKWKKQVKCKRSEEKTIIEII